MKVGGRDAIVATRARTLAADALPERFGVSTDTRSLAPGDAYVALRGERFDGHAFVAQALARGAAALVVEDATVVPAGVAALLVADTTHAYLQLGALARRRSAARLAAVTGSAGKTTTKAFLAQMLEGAAPGRVAATLANENNEIGVAKLLLATPEDATFVVAEFGARHPGEIAPLARAADPDVAVLTNVGDAHLEIMGSARALADTKWGIFSTGAAPVLSLADAVSRERARSLQRPICWFGVVAEREFENAALCRNDTAVLLSRRSGDDATVLIVHTAMQGWAHFETSVPVAGEHNVRNAAAAAAAAFALGVEPSAIARALESLALPPGRYERIDVDGLALIYDAYNASMSGTLATLASFATEPASRRIAVLASMAELGADAPAMHERVGAGAAAARLDALLVGGEFADELARGARGAGLPSERIASFATNRDATAWLHANARAGDLVLLKGSRRYKLEEVVAGLRSVAADA